MKSIEQIEHTKIREVYKLSDEALQCAYLNDILYHLNGLKWDDKDKRFVTSVLAELELINAMSKTMVEAIDKEILRELMKMI